MKIIDVFDEPPGSQPASGLALIGLDRKMINIVVATLAFEAAHPSMPLIVIEDALRHRGPVHITHYRDGDDEGVLFELTDGTTWRHLVGGGWQ